MHLLILSDQEMLKHNISVVIADFVVEHLASLEMDHLWIMAEVCINNQNIKPDFEMLLGALKPILG
jgi:hypothetical protein